MNQPVIWKISRFNELSAAEVYSILRLRSEVFVVEQNCVYQDIDNKDVKALHVIGSSSGEIVAYARIFDAGDYFEQASIGRVIVKQEYRINKIGHQLMRQAISAVTSHFNTSQIAISAQVYLEKFYEQHQFTSVGDGYLEDDIPHIKMQRF